MTRVAVLLFSAIAFVAVAAPSASAGGHSERRPETRTLPGALHPAPEWPITGRRFYLDSMTGNDGLDGQDPASAWQSLEKLSAINLRPGDTVALRRGSTFTGSATLAASGTAARPITVTSYGKGPEPVLTNPGGLHMLHVTGDYVRIANLRFSGGVSFGDSDSTGISGQRYVSSGAIAIAPGADYVRVVNDQFSAVGVGVKTYGLGTRILHNTFRDLTIAFRGVAPGTGQETSYGAIGVSIDSSNANVGWNEFTNCRSLDSPYGADGGAVEIEGTALPKDNIRIHHNFSAGSQGFVEVAESSSSNVQIDYNVSDDYQQFLAFDTTTSPLDYRVLHNSVLRRSPLNATTAFSVFPYRDPGPAPSPDWLSIRDNVLSLPATRALYGSYTDKPFDFPHDHNVFSGSLDPVGYPLGAGDVIARPLFAAAPYAGPGFIHSPGAVRLRPQSPAVHRALTHPAGTDILGRPIPRGGRPDAGAVEVTKTHRDHHRHPHHSS